MLPQPGAMLAASLAAQSRAQVASSGSRMFCAGAWRPGGISPGHRGLLRLVTAHSSLMIIFSRGSSAGQGCMSSPGGTSVTRGQTGILHDRAGCAAQQSGGVVQPPDSCEPGGQFREAARRFDLRAHRASLRTARTRVARAAVAPDSRSRNPHVGWLGWVTGWGLDSAGWPRPQVHDALRRVWWRVTEPGPHDLACDRRRSVHRPGSRSSPPGLHRPPPAAASSGGRASAGHPSRRDERDRRPPRALLRRDRTPR